MTATGPRGELLVHGRPLADQVLLGEVRFVIGGGSLANDAVLEEVDGEWVIQGDPTDAAFLVAEAKIEGLTQAREERFERVGEIPFSSERKLMSTLQADDVEGGITVVTTGAPDVVLTRCAAERVAGTTHAAERRPQGGDHRECRAARRARAANPGGRLPVGAGGRAAAGRRVRRTRPHPPRPRRDHRPTPPGGEKCDRRGHERRRPRGHDHRRPPGHGRPDRGRSRHRRRSGRSTGAELDDLDGRRCATRRGG